MENKIINLNYIKNLNDLSVKNFEINKIELFQNILNNVFTVSIQEHYLFKKIYNYERYNYKIKIDNNKSYFGSIGGQKNSLTFYHDLSKNEMHSIFIEVDGFSKFLYFKNNILNIKCNNNLKKIKVNEYLIPIENRVEYFPNGKIKKEEIFHSEYAIKIDVHYTLSGIVYEKIIMLKDNNYILLKNKHGELEIISNNLNIKEFCEENILKIEDVYELLPLILINFL
jgi:hypothetical protein